MIRSLFSAHSLGLLITVLAVAPTLAVVFTEDFTTTAYMDSSQTTAIWDTGAGELRAPPFVPTLVGSVATPGAPFSVDVAGDYAFVADDYDGRQGRVYGANLAYVVQFKRLWLSAGWGVIRLEMPDEIYGHGFTETSNHNATIPEAVFGVGYDIALSKRVGIRLAGEAGTLIISWRANATAGVVVRF